MSNRWWRLKTGGLVLAIGFVAVILAAQPVMLTQNVPGASVVSCDRQMDSPAVVPPADATDPEGACRIMPECWADEDCDAICGPDNGKCIHNKCPIRICRCG